MKKFFQFITSVLFETIVIIIIVKVIQKVRKVKGAKRSRIFADIGKDEMVEDSFDLDA